MSIPTLETKGIVWNVFRVNGKACFVYGDVTILWDHRLGVYLAQDKQGECILAREKPSDCIEDTTYCILEAYANQFVPSWA